MKKSTLFLISLLLITLTAACGVDNGKQKQPFKAHYNGYWYVKSPTYANYVGIQAHAMPMLSASIGEAHTLAEPKQPGPDTILITKGDKYNLHLNADTLQAKGKPHDVQLIFGIKPIRKKYSNMYIYFQWNLGTDSPYFINEFHTEGNFASVDITHRCTQQSTKIDTIQYNVTSSQDSIRAVILIPVNGLTTTIDEMTNC
jgi:hypothetical protein